MQSKPSLDSGGGKDSTTVSDFVLLATDLNGDGHSDILGLEFADPQSLPMAILAFLGNGDGTFQNAYFNPCADACTRLSLLPSWAATGDFNGDGSPDLAVTNLLDGSVSIFLGVQAVPDFSVVASAPAPADLTPGNSSQATIEVSASQSGMISLSCSVTPQPPLAPECGVSPSSIPPGSSATLTVTTTAASALVAGQTYRYGNTRAAMLAVLLASMTLLSLTKVRPLKLRLLTLGLCGLLTTVMLLAGCGGGSSVGGSGTGGGSSNQSGGGSSGTPAGSYTIQVTGFEGATQRSTTVVITVQ